MPKVHVQDICVRTLLDEQYKDADLQITCKTLGQGKISFTLRDGSVVVAQEQAEVSPEFTVTIPVKAPALLQELSL